MRLGIVGLPNAGKSTLFNSMTNAGAAAEKYPFCTISPNIGFVDVPDRRLDELAELSRPQKKTYASIEFFDIAGLVRGASSGEGLGNKFLSHIREVDAVIHVVRCFEDETVAHVESGIDPVRDIGIVNLELILSDMEILHRRIDKLERSVRSGDKKQLREMELLESLYAHLEKEMPARAFVTDGEEQAGMIAGISLLTAKPVLYVANISEKDISSGDNIYVEQLERYISSERSELIAICAKVEEEISCLDDDEKPGYLEILGIKESGLAKLIRSSYRLLGLISFFTIAGPETKAWTILQGTNALKAAGCIHSDFERGFIRAEVVPFEELMETGSFSAARERGLIRSEGKEYIINDGDVILFRFNV